jgi:hypothetical protein
MEDEVLVKAVEHYIRMPAPDPSKSSPGMF